MVSKMHIKGQEMAFMLTAPLCPALYKHQDENLFCPEEFIA